MYICNHGNNVPLLLGEKQQTIYIFLDIVDMVKVEVTETTNLECLYYMLLNEHFLPNEHVM